MELTDLIPPISGDPLMDAAQQWSSHFPWREPVVEEEETRNKPDSGAGGCAISTKEIQEEGDGSKKEETRFLPTNGAAGCAISTKEIKEGRKNETGEGKKGFGDIEGDWGCVDINGHPSTADSSSIQSSGVILGETQVRKKIVSSPFFC